MPVAVRWTDEEVTRALEMRSLGMTNDQIGNALSRTTKAVKTKFSSLAMTEEQRLKKNEYERARCAARDKTLTKIAGITFEAHKSRVPPEVMAERDARYSAAQRDLTATLLGDPPKGYSALDRSGAA